MKHIHTFESFLNEAESGGPYFLQINLRQSMLGGHSIDAEVASSGTQDFADIRDKSGFLKTPALDKAMAELTLWKNRDKSGKVDASFIKEFEKAMEGIGFKLAKFRYSAPLVKQVADESDAIAAIKDTVKLLDKLYDSYTPESIPVQPGPAASARGLADNLVNKYVSGRGDVVMELAEFISAVAGPKVNKYIKYSDPVYDGPIIDRIKAQYDKERPAKEQTWGVLKASAYKDGVVIVRVEDPKKTLNSILYLFYHIYQIW